LTHPEADEAYRLDLERAQTIQQTCKHAAVDAASRVCIYCGLPRDPEMELTEAELERETPSETAASSPPVKKKRFRRVR